MHEHSHVASPHSPRQARIVLSAFVLFALAATASVAQIHEVTDEVRRARLTEAAAHQRMVMVPMRDGVHLASEIYTPKNSDGPFPVIFWRTPYNFSPLAGSNPSRPNALLKFALDAVERGYAFVVQNERGKFFSEGEWEILGFPRTDGYDALTWLADQPWSTGKVATLGCSSTAEWQMALAAMNHPAHAAAVPMAQGAGIGRMGPFFEQGNFFRGGAIQMPMASWLYGTQNTQRPTFPDDTTREDLIRLATYFDLAPRMPPVDWKKAFFHLPVIELMEAIGGPKGTFAEFGKRLPDDPAWYDGGLYHDNEDFGVPALWMNSWYDLSVGPNLALFHHAHTKASDEAVRNGQYMVIAPTLHCAMYRLEDPTMVGDRDMGTVDFGLDEMLFSFLDRYMKDEDTGFETTYDRVRYYAMGENEWRGTSDWPPPEATELVMYLDSQGSANSLGGDGVLTGNAPGKAPGKAAPTDSFRYDPMNPVPTRGGNFCCLGGEPEGPFDQRSVEARHDVLVYTSEPLEEPLDVAGNIPVTLYVSSDAPDTDFTVKLLDVYPDGRAFNLDDSILRVRYREGFDKKVLMTEGEVYEIELGPLATANVFGVGHRVRVEVSSSNFPRYDRNLNTGGNNYDEVAARTAHNTVHHSAKYPSRIVLPVRPSP